MTNVNQPKEIQRILASVTFSGAGTYGGLEVGAKLALEDNNIDIGDTDGASAGSITAGLIAIGYTGPQLKTVVLDADYSKLIPYNWFNIFKGYLASSSNVLGWLGELTKNQALEDCIIPFKAICTDLIEARPQAWDSRVNTDMLLKDAIYSSMAIPGIFPPYQNRYCDGGVTRNVPIQYLDGPNKISMVVDDGNSTGPFGNSIGMFLRILSILLSDDDQLLDAWAKANNIPVIKLKPKSLSSLGFVCRDMSLDQKSELVDYGREAVNLFLASNAGKLWIKKATTQTTTK